MSDDLLRWHERPVALSPGDGDDGVWSGCISTAHGGTGVTDARLYYTAVDLDDVTVGRIRVATPADDGWDVWDKRATVVTLPPSVKAVAFRDPYVFHDGTHWRLLVGGGTPDGRAVVWGWSSVNRDTWEYNGEFVSRDSRLRDPVWAGEVWECPVVFPLDNRWVLVFSVWEPWVPHWVGYAVGDLVGDQFVATAWGRLAHGPSYYASSTFVDAEGRRGLVHWMRGINDPDGRWAGAASIPQLVRLDDEVLVAVPHPQATTGRKLGSLGSGQSGMFPLPCWIVLEQLDGGTGPLLQLRDEHGHDVLTLSRGDDGLLLAAGQSAVQLAWTDGDAIGLLLDHLIVELFTPDGICGIPLPVISNPTVSIYSDAKATIREVP